MSDPVDPSVPQIDAKVIEDRTKKMQAYDEWLKQTTLDEDNWNRTHVTGLPALKDLNDQLEKHGVTLDNISSKMSQNSAMFGLVTTATLGATKAFRDFTNIDSSSLTTFSDQAKTLFDTIQHAPVGSAASTLATEALTKMLGVAGKSGYEIKQVLAEAGTGITQFAQQLLISADNNLFLQNAMMQTAASGGGLQDFLKETGDNFEHLNDVTNKYGQVMMNSLGATGLGATETGRKSMESYVSMMSQLPGGMKNISDSMKLGTVETTVLTGAIQYAKGAGRSMADVTQDMAKAMNEYGMGAEAGLKYSARMSEVSETLHARLEDVRQAVGQSVDAFKGFVFGGIDAEAMTQNMSKAMQEYVQQLKNVGVPVQNAIKMGENYTDVMSKMSLGQKAFLSQSTGGPGGMMGAYQMEDLMVKDPKAARKKIEETIRKLTGPIVSKEQAKHNQGAADRYTMQLQMLQQGPLGSQAKTQGEAEALLESMRPGAQIKTPNAPGQTLEQTVEAGKSLEQLSMTKVGQVNIQTQQVQFQAGMANFNALQDAMTARSGHAGGANGEGAGINLNRGSIADFQDQNEMASPDKQPGDIIKGLMMSIKSAIPDVGEVGSAYMEAVKGGNQDKIRDSAGSVNAELAKKRASASSEPERAEVDRASKMFAQAMQATSQTGVKLFHPPPDQETAGAQVGRAISVNKSTSGGVHKVGESTAGTGAHQGSPIPVTLAGGSSITVNFVGKCQHCGHEIHDTAQTQVQNAASTRQ